MPQIPTSRVPAADDWQPPFLFQADRLQRRLIPRWLRVLLVLLGVLIGLTHAVGADPAGAAERGSGFGTWAPTSRYGWHGSMLVDGVHTYCITPGRPVPTGATVDHGVDAAAASLTPRQLTGINMLVSAYGQTDDPVQAAAVGWAVKAIADWDDTIHAFGYRGDTLAGAIDAVFSVIAPEHNLDVQRLAVRYFDEATALGAGADAARGALVFTTDAADHRLGTVRVDATVAATGSVSLTDAVFADTGAATRDGVASGETLAIRTSPPAPGLPYAVSGHGRLSAGYAAAVRHYSSPSGQDTAGPGGPVDFEIEGADSAPRTGPFLPVITTRTPARYTGGGAFVDEVIVSAGDTEWPRMADGSSMPLIAKATVYRTMTEPTPGDALPEPAAAVGELALTLDGADEDGSAATATSDWTMDEPGFYTAVWRIAAEDQTAALRARLGEGFSWAERFGEPSQVTVVPSVTTRATAHARPGEQIADTIVVSAPVPASGLRIRSSAYRAVDGVAPGDTCTPDRLVWTSAWVDAPAPGEYTVTSPAVADVGTYYWQEDVVDAEGRAVHRGVCGIENETTRVMAVEPPVAGRRLPVTGESDAALRGAAGLAVALATVGGTLLAGVRRRFGARREIG